MRRIAFLLILAASLMLISCGGTSSPTSQSAGAKVALPGWIILLRYILNLSLYPLWELGIPDRLQKPVLQQT